MKKLNVFIYSGLVVNCLVLGFVWYFVSISFDTPELQWALSYDELRLIDVMSWIRVPFLVAILLQISSLFILNPLPKTALAIAILSSIIMLPLSFIFFIGYLYAYHNRVNESLTEFTGSQAPHCILFKTSQMQTIAILYIIIGFVTGFIGLGVGWLLLVVGIMTLFNLNRLKNRILIGRDADNLIITPDLYSKTYLVPLQYVTVLKNNKKMFKLQFITPDLKRKVTYRKAMLAGEDVEQTLEHIFSQTAKNNTLLSEPSIHP